jgi:hypothetical protein
METERKQFAATTYAACARNQTLVAVHVIAAVGKLNACDLVRAELHFEIGLHYFDVEEFAFFRTATFGADKIEGEVTIVGFDKAVHGAQHYAILCAV